MLKMAYRSLQRVMVKLTTNAFSRNFKDRAIQRELNEEELHELWDNSIENWHDCEQLDSEIAGPLHKFLGMTWVEYARVATTPSYLMELVNKWKKEV